MNEFKKYATFSVDIVGQPMKVSSMFSLGRARIFYLGPNPNYSIIEGEAAYKLASTIPGTPIVGLYDYEKGDFEGHGEGQSAFGFVPLDPNPTWTKVTEGNVEREYLEVDVVIWDGRFEEAKDIISEHKSLSMELNPKTLKGTIVQKGDKRYFQITNAEFAGITVLGEDVQPCFKDAGFLTAYSNMVSAYAKYMSNIQEIEKGGINHMENIDEVKVDEVVEPEINTIEETETEVVVEEETPVVEVEAEASATEAEPTEEVNEAEEQPTEENVEPTEAPAEETEFASETEESDEDETCPECGENPCVCKNECNDEKYQALEAELESYKAKYESLTQELNDALESLKKYTRKEKLEIISKFSTKLEDGEELIADLTEKVDDLTEEEIKSQLGNALVEQIAAEEAEEKTEEETSNFSLNINVNHELGNGAWDLVKRYKESK